MLSRTQDLSDDDDLNDLVAANMVAEENKQEEEVNSNTKTQTQPESKFQGLHQEVLSLCLFVEKEHIFKKLAKN